MIMGMTDGAGTLQLSGQVAFCRYPGIAFRTDDHFDVAFVENFHGASAHAACDDHIYIHIPQKVRQESGPMPGIGHCFGADDTAVLFIEYVETLAMPEMGAYGISNARYCYFHNFLL
jgi:hypothetical protein